MRTGVIIVPPNISKEAVLLEAEFYSILPLIKELRETDVCGGVLFEHISHGKRNHRKSQLIALKFQKRKLFNSFHPKTTFLVYLMMENYVHGKKDNFRL